MPELLTILAAAIAAAASLVAVTLSKEQKVSEFRQAWIFCNRFHEASRSGKTNRHCAAFCFPSAFLMAATTSVTNQKYLVRWRPLWLVGHR